jgi:hypothetical protein
VPQAEYAALLGCPAVFRCDTCSLVFAREVLDRPYSRANTEVARALRSEAEHELGVLLDAELRTRVEQVLGASGESPLPEVVAAADGESTIEDAPYSRDSPRDDSATDSVCTCRSPRAESTVDSATSSACTTR